MPNLINNASHFSSGMTNRGDLAAMPIGQIFTDTFDRVGLGSNWSISGSGTFVCDGSGDLLVANGNSDYIRYCNYIGWVTCLERHTIRATFQVTTSSGSGLGFGVRSANPNSRISYVARLDCTGTGSTGRIYLDYASNSGATTFANIITSTTTMAISINDEIEMIIERDQFTIHVTARNLTQGGMSFVNYTHKLTSPSVYGGFNNTGYITIWNIGGTYSVHDITYSSKENKNVHAAFVGDSITMGLFSENINYRYQDQSNFDKKVIVTHAGGSDKTAEVLLRMPELLLINPKYCFIMIGGNDVFYAVPNATMNANYDSIRNQLVSANIIPIHLYATYRTATDVTTVNTNIKNGASKNDMFIDLYTPIYNSMRISGNTLVDGTHPSRQGMTELSNIIKNNVSFIL